MCKIRSDEIFSVSYSSLHCMIYFFLCFNATISNISAISWQPVLVVEEARVPGENNRPWGSNWQALSLAAASRVHPFCNLQSRARTHAVIPHCIGTLSPKTTLHNRPDFIDTQIVKYQFKRCHPFLQKATIIIIMTKL